MRLTDPLYLSMAERLRAQPLGEGSMPDGMHDQLTLYRYGDGGWDTKKVAVGTTDDQIRSLCRFYELSPADRRLSMRAAVTLDGAQNLLYFALRSATFTIRSETTKEAEEWLVLGILAIALADLANNDPRDDITILHKLYSAGAHAGVDSLGFLREALRYCGSGVRQIIDCYFLSRPPEAVGDGFDFEIIPTPCGISITYP